MSGYKYAFEKFNDELMARALAKDAAVSTKVAIEMCSYLRGRKIVQAKSLLREVLEMKRAIPYKRFTDGVGHRAGKMGPGRFPQKGSQIVLDLLESVEANAQLKGLNTSELSIIHICAHKAHCPVHYGRHSGRSYKRTHVEVVVAETPEKKKIVKKSYSKTEAKPKVEAKVEKKTEAKPETVSTETVEKQKAEGAQ